LLLLDFEGFDDFEDLEELYDLDFLCFCYDYSGLDLGTDSSIFSFSSSSDSSYHS